MAERLKDCCAFFQRALFDTPWPMSVRCWSQRQVLKLLTMRNPASLRLKPTMYLYPFLYFLISGNIARHHHPRIVGESLRQRKPMACTEQ